MSLFKCERSLRPAGCSGITHDTVRNGVRYEKGAHHVFFLSSDALPVFVDARASFQKKGKGLSGSTSTKILTVACVSNQRLVTVSRGAYEGVLAVEYSSVQ